MNVTGSLQIKSGTYYAVVRVPAESGKIKQKWISTGIKAEGKNQKEKNRNKLDAEAFLAQTISKYQISNAVYSDKLFLSRLDEWMERKKPNVSQSTYELYELYVRVHIRPFFEPLNLKIGEVTTRYIQEYIQAKYSEGQSAKSIKKHLVLIRGVFDEALRFREISYNPCNSLTVPKSEKFVGKAYTTEEANNLISVLNGEPIKPAVMLGLFLGLRRSEALGLRWSDIDFETDTVHIRNTVVKMNTTIEQEKTKSEASRRDLAMPEKLKDYLLSLKKEQDKNRGLLGQAYHDGDHVCVWDDGSPLKTEYVSHRFKTILEKNNLPPIRYHELRHTAGSILLDQGQNLKQVQEFLGHEDIRTTSNIYLHLTKEKKREAAKAMDSAFDRN